MLDDLHSRKRIPETFSISSMTKGAMKPIRDAGMVKNAAQNTPGHGVGSNQDHSVGTASYLLHDPDTLPKFWFVQNLIYR